MVTEVNKSVKDNVTIKKLIHREKRVIVISFPFNHKIQEQVKQLEGRMWSNTHKGWYIEDTAEAEEKIRQIVEGRIENKRTGKAAAAPFLALPHLTEEKCDKIREFERWMASRRYSGSTILTYTDALKIFLRYYAHKPVAEITNGDVVSFNNDYIIKNRLSSSYQNQVVNAVKLFFREVNGSRLEPELVHRPKRAHILPNVLSKEEVKLVLGASLNIKHRTMLSLIYACGLRRGELLNLKKTDLDEERMLVIIRQAKGKKDRIVPLSKKVLELVKQYYISFMPEYWVFEGQDRKNQYDERSLASVLKNAVHRAGITKPVTLHWLRHSYATHLLENGTDLRYIQEILGHKSSRTTEIYTHVSSHHIQKINSPFDAL